MLKSVLTGAIAILLLAAATTQAHQTNEGGGISSKAVRYYVKSAIIEFTYSGNQTGSETMYFDRNGMREATFSNTVTKVMGIESPANTISILLGEYLYNIDLNSKTGTKMVNPLFAGLAEAHGTEDFAKIGEKMLIDMGGVKIGKETICGKECDVWELKQMNTKTWTWNAVTLKSEVNVMGMTIVKTATSIKENVSIPEDKFKVPAGIEISEVDLGKESGDD